MTKYKALIIILSIDIITIVFAHEIETLSVSQDIASGLIPIGEQSSYVSSVFDTFINLLTFQLYGLPDILSLFFIPLQFVLLFIIAELIRGN